MKPSYVCLFILSLAVMPVSGLEPSNLDAHKSVFTKDFPRLWLAGDAAGLAELWASDGDWMSMAWPSGLAPWPPYGQFGKIRGTGIGAEFVVMT